MSTLAECGHTQWSASWQTTPCQQISGRNVISSISSSWPKPIMEDFKVPWNSQKLAEHGHFSSDLLHGTLHHLTKFQVDSRNPERVKAVTSSLGPGPSLFWKFQSSVECAKTGRACPFYTAICFSTMCIIPPNFRPIAKMLKELKR